MANETKYPAKIHITDARPKTTSFLKYLPNDRGPALQKRPSKTYGNNLYPQAATFGATTAPATTSVTKCAPTTTLLIAIKKPKI